jgi:hypothetical protein
MKKRSPVKYGDLPRRGPAESQYERMQYTPKIVPHRGDVGYAYPSKHASAYKSTKPGRGAGATRTVDRKFDEIDRTPIRTWASARTDNYSGPGRTAGRPSVGGGLDYIKPQKEGREPDKLRGRVMPQTGPIRKAYPEKEGRYDK